VRTRDLNRISERHLRDADHEDLTPVGTCVDSQDGYARPTVTAVSGNEMHMPSLDCMDHEQVDPISDRCHWKILVILCSVVMRQQERGVECSNVRMLRLISGSTG
jgi:hypothetical protein